MARPRRHQGGFTLVEILVTVIITMIGLLGLMATFTASSRGSLDSRRTDQALALTEGAIEEIKQRTVAEIELANSAITATGWTVAYGAAIAGPSGVSYTRSLTARALDPDLVLFRVTTEWAADGGSSANTQYQRKVELELVRGRAEQ